MGKGTNQIATWGDVKSLFVDSAGSLSETKCPTKIELTDRGYTISGTYASNQCVKWTDIKLTYPVKFNLYYAVWNNKNSNAIGINVEVYLRIKSSGSWVQVGVVDIGNVSSVKSGSVSCSIPSSVDLSVAQEIKVYFGRTAANQYWQYTWGDGSNISSIPNAQWNIVSGGSQKSGSVIRDFKSYFSGTGASSTNAYIMQIS